MKRLVALALSSGLLAGCTGTSPIPVDIARKAPAERVSGGPDGQARITVVRDAELWTSFCPASLYIDGDRIARLEAEEKVTVGVRAGDPVLVRAAQDGGGLCAWLPSSRSLETRLEPGQHRFYRISFARSGRVDLQEDTLWPRRERASDTSRPGPATSISGAGRTSPANSVINK